MFSPKSRGFSVPLFAASLLLVLAAGAFAESSKYAKALEAMGDRSFIDANGQTFRRFVINGPRDYTAIVFITATSAQCAACTALDPAFQRVADTYMGLSSVNKDSKLVFIRAEISHLQDLYNVLSTKFQEVPQIFRLPPTTKSGSQFEFARSDVFVITTESLNAQAISKFVKEKTGVDIPIVELPWQMIFISIGISTVVLLAIKFVPNPLNHLRNPYLYMTLVFVLCAANFGGTPFNLINNPPFIYADPYSGRVIWYLRSARSQLKLEGMIVGVSVVSWAMSLVGLQEWALKQKHPVRRAIGVCTLGGLLVVISLFIHFLFKEKYGFYPY